MYRTLTHSGKRKFNKAEFFHFAFYMGFLIVPIVHFFIFYLFVNMNSFILAFQSYKFDYIGNDGLVGSFAGFENFKIAWQAVAEKPTMMGYSFLFVSIDLFISQPLAILASYYIYKKKPGSGFFRFVLYLPQVLSSIVLGILFKYAIQIFGMDILVNDNTKLWMMVFFNILMSFGVNVLLYSNAMGNVNPSLIESASLEGANTLQILWHVVLPKIYPTIISLAIVIVSQLFTSQYQVFNIHGQDAQGLENIGYFIYKTSLNSNLEGTIDSISYPALSALGLSLTAIIVPITFLTKFLLSKFGPKED